MNKITFLPSISDQISDIICDNNIVTPVTLTEQNGVVEMHFEIELHRRLAMATITLVGAK